MFDVDHGERRDPVDRRLDRGREPGDVVASPIVTSEKTDDQPMRLLNAFEALASGPRVAISRAVIAEMCRRRSSWSTISGTIVSARALACRNIPPPPAFLFRLSVI